MLSEKELEELAASRTPFDERFYKGVLYGEFGVRKTTTALRCSELRAILLHADRGWNVIANHPDEFNEENVIPLKYQGLSQVKAIVEAVVSNQEPYNNVDLFVLDTISQMQENYVDWLVENFEYSGNFREKAVPKTGVKGERPVEITGLPDYHLARNKMRPVINLLTRAPVNVIYLAHTREPSAMERQSGKIERRPNVTEAVYKILARDATFIGYMEKSKENYTIDFTPKNTQSAKSQIAELADKKIKTDELPEFLKKWSK